MLDPPLDPGAVNETVAWALPAEAETPVGAPGTVIVVPEAFVLVAETRPRISKADTEYVYVVPEERPESW